MAQDPEPGIYLDKNGQPISKLNDETTWPSKDLAEGIRTALKTIETNASLLTARGYNVSFFGRAGNAEVPTTVMIDKNTREEL